jgi:hypothetical protein
MAVAPMRVVMRAVVMRTVVRAMVGAMVGAVVRMMGFMRLMTTARFLTLAFLISRAAAGHGLAALTAAVLLLMATIVHEIVPVDVISHVARVGRFCQCCIIGRRVRRARRRSSLGGSQSAQCHVELDHGPTKLPPEADEAVHTVVVVGPEAGPVQVPEPVLSDIAGIHHVEAVVRGGLMRIFSAW